MRVCMHVSYVYRLKWARAACRMLLGMRWNSLQSVQCCGLTCISSAGVTLPKLAVPSTLVV